MAPVASIFTILILLGFKSHHVIGGLPIVMWHGLGKYSFVLLFTSPFFNVKISLSSHEPYPTGCDYVINSDITNNNVMYKEWSFRTLFSHIINQNLSNIFLVGDVCCNPLSLGGLQKFIEEVVPSVYVKSLKIGKTVNEVSSGHLYYFSVST